MKKQSLAIRARVTVITVLLISSALLIILGFNSRIFARVRNLAKESKAAAAAVNVPSTVLFSHNTIVDFSAVSGEPFINSAPVAVAPNTPAGAPFISAPFGFSTTISLLWKSIDGGRTFIPLGTPITRDSVTGPGGGDTHQYFDALGRFYFADLAAACVTAAVSDDGGNTFPRVTPIACIGTSDPTGPVDDRQWIGAFGDGRGYTTVRNNGLTSFHFNRTRDAGANWEGSQLIGTVSQSAPMIVDKVKRNFGGTDYIVVYQPYYTGNPGTTLHMFRIRDPDTGAPVIVDDIIIGTPGGAVSTVFPVMAIDVGGNLYMTWSSGSAIFMMTSTDHGDTWSAVKRVSPTTGPEGTGTIQMPWVIAGDPGRVDIVWYRGSLPGNSTSNSNYWDIYMAQTLNAFAAAPTFTYTKVNETNIHFGIICTGGTFCDVPGGVVGQSGDRSFLEFPSITIDDRGAAMITWNDNTNQSAVTAATPTVPGGAYVMFSKQLCGPSLFSSVGFVGQPGTVAITSPVNNAVVTPPVTVQGTHTIPPGTFDRDEAADAKFPDHGATIGANIPAFDIQQVDMTENATNLIVHMRVADATTAALSSAPMAANGDGLLYLVQWDYDESVADPIDKVFWVAAEIRAGQTLGRTGTLGVIRSALSKKYITYNPDVQNSLQVTATITNTAPGTITLTIPKSLIGNPPNGARLNSVTGYAMSERGPLAATPCPPAPASCENIFDPSSLPIQVDAAGAFTYVVGTGMQLDGFVEVSLDDPNFSFPTAATANVNGTWQTSLSGISSGTHMLFAHQVVRGGCATSSPVSIQFSVPGPPVPTLVVSRKTHGTAGTFDVDLLPPAPGIECRSGGSPTGNHKIFVAFPLPVSVASASVTSGTGSVSSFSVSGNQVTVNLTAVGNAQRIAVTLANVSDGVNSGDVTVPMGVLLGDVNFNGRVTNGDVSSIQAQVGASVISSNFRNDVNANGTLSNGDVAAAQAQVGAQLP
jgi:hypothetical protein